MAPSLGTAGQSASYQRGDWLFKVMLKRTVEPHFLSKLEEVKKLTPSVSAEDFLNEFPNGGAIYRIFWLHCWHPDRFPIYDQHVHRAMVFIWDGQVDELDKYSDEEKIDRYLEYYVPFFNQFRDVGQFDQERDGVRGRKADRALVTFGLELKSRTFRKMIAAA